MVEIGKKAIDFTLPDENGIMHSLSDYLGKKVVLYFYPKDNTSGCTNQALEFKRLYDEFSKNNTIIIGISKDSSKSHNNFKKKYDFPFVLLSDENKDAISKYDVLHEKSMYGKKYMGVVRSTFIIDEEGIVRSIDRNVSASTNANDSLCFINKNFN